jgi:flagellar biosynthetic protein FlhB
MRRMMADVPKASVVVTNPTHYAVALRYERAAVDGRGAPVVVAKGVDHLAERIKSIARAHGVACHEDVALARALHARVRIGQEIPAELYAAVAAVLATVYRLEEAHA